MGSITIPDFQFSSHFYPEIIEDLISYLRQNCPELTDEDPTEPHIQLLRAFALSNHLNNVLLDMVANESFLPTAKLLASHRQLLALIDVKLKQTSPASVDIVAQLTRRFTAAQITIQAGALFATLDSAAASSVEYENLVAVTTVTRTDQVDLVYAYNKTGNAFTDHSAEAQSPAGAFTTAWGAGNVENGDALYIGHRGILWDKMVFDIVTPTVGVVGVWEYFDGSMDEGNPTSVTNLGDSLRFNVNSVLGSASRAGTIVRVRSSTTGAFQDLVSVWDIGSGENRITTVVGVNGFLGQTIPSADANQYTVGSAWRELPNVVDGTANLTAAIGKAAVDFTLPQVTTPLVEDNWRKTTVGTGGLAVEAYWVRFRIISASNPAAALPQINSVDISSGQQYQVANLTQGRTRTQDPLGSSDGTADQQFGLSNFPVIDDTNIIITVNEGVDKVYTRVDNFLNSIPTDRHYKVDFDDDGAALITFGDGTNGKIPPAGVNNIRATYRTMGDVNGNVGSGTITVNRTGVAYLSNIVNPRAASGYLPKEGSTDEDLLRLKIAGPAQLRVRGRAVTPPDVETMALAFVASDGSRPVARALAIEESYGPKTIECVVVGPGGTQVDSSKLAELDAFFNGDGSTQKGVLVMNNQATSTNFTPKSIDVTAIVTGGNEAAILTALTLLLNPLAADPDTGEYLWTFGGLVPLARLIQVIMDTSPRPTNVLISTPASDDSLGQRELPAAGTLSITVV